jgi:type VI secretion system protein ImpA
MASLPLLDFDALMAPLPEEGVGLPTVFRDLRGEFEALIREEDPTSFPEGDPRRDSPKKADWRGVVNLARAALTDRSKDVRIAAWLTVGLSQVQRFAGLRDGLHLLRLLVTDCWDRLNPPFEKDDPGQRGELIAAILDADAGEPRFPGRVRLLPLVKGDRQEYGAYNLKCNHASSSDGALAREDIDWAKGRLSPEECQQLAEDIGQGLEELNGLRAALTAWAPSQPPSFENLRAALLDCQGHVADFLRTKIPSRLPVQPPAANGSPSGGALAAGDVVAARRRAYEQLTEAATMLERLEPGSPVPHVIRKVIHWGQMSFPELLRANVLEVFTKVVTHQEPS